MLSSRAPSKAADAGSVSVGARVVRTLTSPYFLACIVYLAYSIIIMIVDFYWSVRAAAAFPSKADTPTTDDYGYYSKPDVAVFRSLTATTNWGYLAAGIVHLVSALMFIYVWSRQVDPKTGKGYTLTSYVQVPEYLNVAEATLYLATACLYPNEVILNKTSGVIAYTDSTTVLVKQIELAASILQLIACFGWMYTWGWTHVQGKGRGLTLDDPDVWALTFLTVPNVIYVTYNSFVIQNP